MKNDASALDNKEYLNLLSTEDFLRFSFNIRFSKCLVRRRKMLGLTQEALATKSGVNRVTIANIEARQRLASIEVILKLLNALDMEIQFIEK